VDSLAFYLLDSHCKHRPIALCKDRRANFDAIVGANREKELVERDVMQLAQGEPVRDYRFPFRLGIARDVRRIQQWPMPETTEGTALVVCTENAFPKRLLVDSIFEASRHVLASRRSTFLCDSACVYGLNDHAGVVDLQLEKLRNRILANYKYRERRDIHAFFDRVEIDNRDPSNSNLR
jgi:hypothetical protein